MSIIIFAPKAVKIKNNITRTFNAQWNQKSRQSGASSLPHNLCCGKTDRVGNLRNPLEGALELGAAVHVTDCNEPNQTTRLSECARLECGRTSLRWSSACHTWTGRVFWRCTRSTPPLLSCLQSPVGFSGEDCCSAPDLKCRARIICEFWNGFSHMCQLQMFFLLDLRVFYRCGDLKRDPYGETGLSQSCWEENTVK